MLQERGGIRINRSEARVERGRALNETRRARIKAAEEVTEGYQPFFRSMNIAASGLSAQRSRIDVIADNIANAETTRTADGTPYRRKIVQLQEIPYAEEMAERRTEGSGPYEEGAEAGGQVGGVEVAGIFEDRSAGPIVYDPGHPDANEDGYVQMSNVQITTELVDLMEARRLYEANASVFEAVKAMLSRATQL